MSWEKSDYNFKKGLSRRVTAVSKQYYEEESDVGQNIHMSEVWSDEISTDPAEAALAGVVSLYNFTQLTEDLTVADSRCYYVSVGNVRIKDFVSEKYGVDYRARLYDGNNVEIFPTDVSGWIFDYNTGTVMFNGSTSAFVKPLKIVVYKYVGRKGGSGVDESISPTWVGKHVFKNDVKIQTKPALFGQKELSFNVDGAQIGMLEDGLYLGGMRVSTDRLNMESFCPSPEIQDSFHPDVTNCFTCISASGQYVLVTTWSEQYLSWDYGETWFSNLNPKFSQSPKVTSGKWAGIPTVTSNMYYGNAMSADGKIMYLYSNSSGDTINGIWASYDFGATWQQKVTHSQLGAWNTGTGVFSLICSSDGKKVLFGCGNAVTGGSFLSNDFGNTFVRLVYNPAGTGTQFLNYMSSNGEILFCGGSVTRGVWMSKDGGSTFINLSTLNSNVRAGIYAVSSSNGKIIIINSSLTNSPWSHRSEDFGETWVSTPVIFPATPEIPTPGPISASASCEFVLCVMSLGTLKMRKIYKSIDYGKTYVDTGMPVLDYTTSCISYDGKLVYVPTYYRAGFYTSVAKIRLRSDLRLKEINSTDYKLNSLPLFDRKQITVSASTGIYNFVFLTEGFSDQVNVLYSVCLTLSGDNSRKCWAISNTKTMTGFVIELIQSSGVAYDAEVNGSVTVDVLIIRS